MSGYLIRCKDGIVKTDAAGNIAYDGRGRSYHRTPDPSWRILGFTTRHHAHDIITLAQAAAGRDIGQGWVHDVDHGTHRMWVMPKGGRAVSVEVLA